MASRIRALVANKVLQALVRLPPAAAAAHNRQPVTADALQTIIRIDPRSSTAVAGALGGNTKAATSSGDDGGAIGCMLSLRRLHSALHDEDTTRVSEKPDLLGLGSELVQRMDVDDEVAAAHLDPKKTDVWLRFRVPCRSLTAPLLRGVVQAPSSFWRDSALLATIPHQRTVLEFSSPNIAKPFHVGHLRSTILGHCLGCLHSALGHTVTRINYLGDWGTQFGMLKYGYDAKGLSTDDLATDAVRKLYEVYVYANKAAETDAAVSVAAQRTFASMERGDQEELELWRFFKDISLQDLRSMYSRLGVHFDEYHGESQYSAAHCEGVVRLMEERGLLQQHPDGRKMMQVAPSRQVTVVKSDGGSLYLSRDIAAAVDRYQRYSFDRHYYVVDLAQTNHFKDLFSALNALQYDWSGNMRHVRFGRIQGMSSRAGNALFLSDLLDDGRQQMIANQTLSQTTCVEGEEAEAAADTVALSAVVVADLKQRRHKDYKFSWKTALQSSGDTGVKLQYAHCRLVRLQETCGINLTSEADTSTLMHDEAAVQLIASIARYDEVLYDFYQELEPCIMVAYLFKLSASINTALNQLPVRNAPPTTAEARLLLFAAAQHTLAAGISVLGLKPLNRM